MKTLSVVQKYLLGMALWMGLYVVALFSSIYTIRTQAPQGLLLYVLAVLPALPIGGSLWVVERYIAKSDEYVRAIMSRTFVISTGVLLFLLTVCGFLEENAGLMHFELIWAYPAFWIIFAVVQTINRMVCAEIC